MDREHRVIGPPGTGKTTYLSRQCQLAAEKYGAANVAVASLTRAAAEEVAGRDTGIPRERIGTLHSHCYRALDRPVIAEAGKAIEAWNEHAPIGFRLSGGRGADALDWAPPEGWTGDGEGDKLMAEYQLLRARMRPRELWRGGVRSFAERWEDWKRQTGTVDFTDLIEHALENVDVMPGEPAVIMFDEAQDMSRLEFALARKWAEHAEQLVVVGDPDQNLYEWRGSDVDAFSRGEPASYRVLEQSYRVPRAVHAWAVRWIDAIPGRSPVAYQPRDEDGGVSFAGIRWTTPNATGNLAGELEAADGSSMILATCSYMLRPLIDELKRTATPFHNPYRPTHGGWNPLRGARRIVAFLSPQATGEPWTWAQLHAWADPLDAKAVFQRGVKTYLEARCEPDRFGRGPNEAVPVDFLASNCFANTDAASAAAQGDLEWYRRHLRKTKSGGLVYCLDVAARLGAAALEREPRIIVGTIHSVKGGEADRVYVFPDVSHEAYASMQVPSGAAAMRRVFYVAATRARRELVLCKASSGLAATIQ